MGLFSRRSLFFAKSMHVLKEKYSLGLRLCGWCKIDQHSYETQSVVSSNCAFNRRPRKAFSFYLFHSLFNFILHPLSLFRWRSLQIGFFDHFEYSRLLYEITHRGNIASYTVNVYTSYCYSVYFNLSANQSSHFPPALSLSLCF